jgi:hypothetical protein
VDDFGFRQNAGNGFHVQGYGATKILDGHSDRFWYAATSASWRKSITQNHRGIRHQLGVGAVLVGDGLNASGAHITEQTDESGNLNYDGKKFKAWMK